MTVKILYCKSCGANLQARRIADEIKHNFQIESELLDVGEGRFEVTVNGKPVFSKAVEGRFPRNGEVTARLRGGA